MWIHSSTETVCLRLRHSLVIKHGSVNGLGTET